jgi:hypothetical protein
MVLIVLHPANASTARAGRPPKGVIPGLCRDDRLLEASQQPLRFGQGRPLLACSLAQVGDIGGPFDLYDVSGLSVTFSVDFIDLKTQATRSKNRRGNTPFDACAPKLAAVPGTVDRVGDVVFNVWD